IQVELLEKIVGYIDSVINLLSFALTCRELCVLIIPWHIEYRWISCHPGRTDIWKMLSIKPHLAARLQHLEIHRHEDFA
ncbi:hypothetical protein M422DRAFT_98664, partial [Sphaerobolus stellatus SS14]